MDLILVVADTVPAVAEVAVVTILAVAVVAEAVEGMLATCSGMTRESLTSLKIIPLPLPTTSNMMTMVVISTTMTTRILEITLAWYPT